MALRASDVMVILSDPRTKPLEGRDYVRIQGVPEGAAARFLRDFFLFGSGAEHRAKRGMFARSFAHGAVRAAQPQIQAVARRIVAELPRGESFDFIDRMAARVPAEMIAAILGLPQSETSYFAPRVYAMSRAVSPVYPIDDHAEIETAVSELFRYVVDHMRIRSEQPRDDLLSRLVADWKDDPVITFSTLVHQVLGIIVGGTDTTRAAFAVLVSLLLQHPEQWTALRDDPSLIPGAVSEGLRYDPSVGSIVRFTNAPVEISGVELPAGVMLRISNMSAMRDPELYAEPDRFDIRRNDHPRLHPVFGAGAHRCIGEMLARIEMQEGLAALVAGAPAMELQTAPQLQGFGGLRQITPMQVIIR
ncbi:cytochrome P450 [Hoeflea marina]|nr:cytochrome P450 [Hoeflea marina]